MTPANRPRGWGNLFFPALPARKLRSWQRTLARILRAVGPTWRAAPIRRMIQAGCFVLYLALFFRVAWPYSAEFSSLIIADKQFMPLEFFLWIDPLVGLSTAVAARAWNVALIGMLAIGLFCLLFPRGFCGYICPLGTLIDAIDFAIHRPMRWMLKKIGLIHEARAIRLTLATEHANTTAAKARPWWAHIKFFLLIAVMVASLLGILLSGYVAAIPVLTRGLLFSGGQLQLGLGKNWGIAPPMSAAIWLSLALFAVVLLLGFFSPRFWCKYVCPSGALFSVFNLFRAGERKVESSCINCNKCVEVCPFDAIKPDFTTRTLDCTFCQTCGGVCPTQAIKFVTRWNDDQLKSEDQPGESSAISRRGAVLSILGGAIAALATRGASPASLPPNQRPLRPPGSVPEEQFLDLCIRCGECFKVCPGPVLQASGLAQGLESLWTPVAVPTHAGCHQDCNFCTLVCPTHAIIPLTIAQKRKTPMGLAIVNAATCLPHAGREDCKLCYDECKAAGYHAIEIRTIKLHVGEIPEGVVSDEEREQMGHITAPFVDPSLCTGCGLCEYRCSAALVHQRKKLTHAAIAVVSEDRKQPRTIRPLPTALIINTDVQR